MKNQTISETAKRHLISAGLTFATGFALVMVVDINSLTLESIKAGALVGTVFMASRAGLKLVLEKFLAWRAKQ